MKDVKKDMDALERRVQDLRRNRDSSKIAGWRTHRDEDWEDGRWPESRVPRDENGWPIEPTPGEKPDHIDPDATLLSDWLGQQQVRYESPREYARAQAQGFLLQHLLEDLDPDELLITTLYINGQDAAPQRANIAHSMTLTDALMCNWQQSGNGQFLEHLSTLRDYRDGGYPVRISAAPLGLWDCFAYEAIYRKTSPQRFDASTHVALDPVTFKAYVWEVDLQAHYQATLTHFWAEHGADYNLLIKAALLRSAYVQHAEGSLSTEDKSLVLRGLGLAPSQTWEALTFKHFADALLPHDITFRELVLYRYVATDIIVLRDEQTDRLVMYVPGNSSPLHGFSNLPALRAWVALQCKDARRRKALERHFRLEDDPDGLFYSGIQKTLAGLAAYPHFLDQATGYWNPSNEVHLGAALSPWPFSHFKHALQARLQADGKQLIRNRADHNKEVAAQALSNAIAATGAIAMVVPYLWGPLAAMSLALIGLGADEVIEGRTLEEKKNGTGRIVFGVLNAVPALAEGAVTAGSLLGAAARAGDQAIPGAADEVASMTGARTEAERSLALARQQEAHAQQAEEVVEHASESSDERAARLIEEEHQRLAIKSQHAARYDSAIAFGVEPQGLRALGPELRTALARFEYKTPLDPSGTWKTDELGAVYDVSHPATGEPRYYARVHSKLYPVERVQAAGQYRIYAPDDARLKGPYVKRVQGFYSDIDLRPGLRGGDSFIEELPPVPLPVGKDGIVLTRAQPPVTIEMPMDGIETRWVEDEEGKRIPRYFANNVPEGTKVIYNAEIACWESGTDKLLWLDNKGRWRSGTEEAYLKVRDKLRPSVGNVFYTFRRLPGFPANPQPIEHIVHQVWLGRRLPGEKLIGNIKSNLRISPELKFTMHVDIDDTAAVEGLSPQAQLQEAFAEFPNMTISRLQDEPFFEGFMNDPHTSTAFSYFRRGAFENFAAASDILRYRLIREYGGIYMDCDDVIGRTFSGGELLAGPHDVLVGGTLESPTLSFKGPGNSHFASRPGNPVLKEMEQEIHARFTKQHATLEALASSRNQSSAAMTAYMTQISELTGPKLFLDVLKQVRPDYADILDDGFKIDTNVYSSEYFERLNRVKDFYRPFASRFRIFPGAENSWKAPGA
ncbi:dermonecrotic toxin domain-containing protein [Pseudomonas petrae]|uniref:dermonecrotic toxin domain-containing protein n=1 Tax=Pseudomonas petrae TaxID=2912190 RepID=UPI001EEFBC3B|nr:DUF6543 domain-containing protein [Pseudomonas petrae]MCF7534474.1 glycosyltransferase sugar-binding domain-conteining protein [Pseudomonas petrae]MCF7539940.1 glycosyltransferase sugar-binding domain-conteining protein [Pseudomonas petrae]MCF7558242.1 glycosyltransferase sugar-binding domain-conteining protein [Pseudomonas petrae]